MRRDPNGGGEPRPIPPPPLIASKVPGSERELSLVDPDIAETYRGIANYVVGAPQVAQAIREMRLVREEMRLLREEIAKPRMGFLRRLFVG